MWVSFVRRKRFAPSLNHVVGSNCPPGRVARLSTCFDSRSTSLSTGGLAQNGWNRINAEGDSLHGIFRNFFSYWPLCRNNHTSEVRNETFPNFGHELAGETLLRHSQRTPETAAVIGSENNKREKLWRDLLADPSKWWDNRGKFNPKFPDFKHKQTGEALWLDREGTPAWVPSEILATFGSESDKIDKLWNDFFADPSKWWDNRPGKVNPTFPDLKRKKTGETLWVDNACTPEWVKLKMASLKCVDYDQKWQDLFSNSSEWWDHRSRKANAKFPDFIHKLSTEGLWLDGKQTPPWVASKVPCLGLISLKSHVIQAVQRLSRYNKAGLFLQTLEYFEQMLERGIHPDCYIFLHVLHACASIGALEEGQRIHQKIIETGWELHPHVNSSLIDMYSKCGSLEDAWNVFNNMPNRNVVCWNAMILGCVKCEQGLEALELFQRMQREGVVPCTITFLALLNACASIPSLEEGRRAHSQIVQNGWETDLFVGSSLVDMYAKCGSIQEAQAVFDKMPTRNVVAWTAMMIALVKCGQGVETIQLYEQMQRDGVQPTSRTFVALLNACASIPALEEGRRVHNQAVQSGCESDIYVGTSLVDMYAKCGSLEEAQAVFDRMPERNVVSWTAMIMGFVKSGQGLEALHLYKQMRLEDVEPDSATFVAILNACASMAGLEEGRLVHLDIIEIGYQSNTCIGSALVDMYAKCGSIEDARMVFDHMPSRDVVSWNAMILGYATCGLVKEALSLFEEMSHSGCEMNEVTFICLLSACSHGGLVKEGLQYFGQMHSRYGLSPTQEHYTCIVDILGRAGHLEDAEAMIKGMPLEPSAALWRALLGACRTYGYWDMGERAAEQVLKLDPENSAGYVLLSNIHAAAGHFDRQKIDKSRI